jgi:hypothetical protein
MNPAEVSQLTTRLRMMDDDALTAFGEMHKTDPNVFPLVFTESMFRQSVDRNQKMQQGSAAPVNEQALASMQARAQPLPEEVGIGALPAGNMTFAAEGGIMGFSDGGGARAEYEAMIREEAERQGVDPEHLLRLVEAESRFNPKAVSPKNAAGLMQLMPGTAKDLGLTEAERFDPQKSVAGGTRYFKQLLDRFGGDYEKATAAYNWGPNREALTKPDWKLGLPKETAAYLTKIMPMGSAQAAPTAAPAAQAPAVSEDATVYSDLGVPVYQGTPVEYKESPTKILKEMARPVVKGVTKAAKAITSAPKTREELEEERVAAIAPGTAGSQGPLSGAAWGEEAPAQPDLSPKQEKQVIAAAKEAVPASVDTSGWSSEDWLTLGFSLLSSKAPRLTEAFGESGLKVLAGQQARTKAGLDALKTKQDIAQSESMSKYYQSMARRADAEDKPLSQMRKEIAAAMLKLESNPLLQLDPQKLAAEKRRVAADIMSYYPELADTIGSGAAAGTAAPQGVKVTRIGP